MTNDELVEKYAALIEPLLPLAQKAYGPRDQDTPQHEASRAYTKYLCEFYESGGSLLDLGKRLHVNYAGMRRRITTAPLAPRKARPDVAYTDVEYKVAADAVITSKSGGTDVYHRTIKSYYDKGFSMKKLADAMGLSSANPLYFGVNQIRLAEEA